MVRWDSVPGRAAALVVLLTLALAPASGTRAAGDEEDAVSQGPSTTLVIGLGHGETVEAIAVSPDDRHVLSGSGDGIACLWELATGREIRRFEGHRDAIHAVAFSPDGRHVLTGSSDRTARLWDVRTGEEVRRFEGDFRDVQSVAFSPDGRQVLLASTSCRPGLWDVATGREIQRFGVDEPFTRAGDRAVLSPDGKYVLTASFEVARLWEVETGQEIRRFEGHEYWICALAFSPDGRQVLTCAGDLFGDKDQTARLWDARTGREIRRFVGHEGAVEDGAFSPDGKLVLTCSVGTNEDWETMGYGTARLWDVATGAEVYRLESDGRGFNTVAWTSDGASFLIGNVTGTVCLHDLASKGPRGLLEGGGCRVHVAAFPPDGGQLLIASQQASATLWSLATGRPKRLDGHLTSPTTVAFSPDGRSALTGAADGTAVLWDLPSGREIRRFVWHESAINSVAFSPDGRLAVTGAGNSITGKDWMARVWDVATGEEVRRFDEPDALVSSVSFSPNGRLVLASTWDGYTRFWDVRTGEEVRRFKSVDINAWSLCSADGRFVVTGSYGTPVGFWSVETGEQVFSLEGEEARAICGTFSPGGLELLTGSRDGTVRLWDLRTGREIRRFEGHLDTVNSVAFSPSGTHVVTGSDDRTVRLWETETGKEVCTIVLFWDGTWAVVAPDGRFDTNDLEEVEWLHWVVSDDPLRALSVEVFMRDYYEPQLLARLLAGEVLPPLPRLAALNRTQPGVDVVAVEPDSEAQGRVTVRVAVESRSRSIVRDESEVRVRSGAQDLRLFRDGQVVGWVDGSLDLHEGRAELAFPGVRVPRGDEAREIVFSAYAFNEAYGSLKGGVKSPTARRTWTSPPTAGVGTGSAYVVAFGVDAFAHPQWDLTYAADDARVFAASVTASLRDGNAYARVVPIVLVSTRDVEPDGERTPRDRARKSDLQAVLGVLAGVPPTAEALARIPELSEIRPAGPEDLVILAFSTHGVAGEDGAFHLLPSDVAAAGPGWKPSCVSTDDLARWLRPVDAGEMAMVVDACQSAASVERDGFKPGPMGSRGFGQLAWEKKMRVLAASQSSEYAIESRLVRHGLLTYALTADGLAKGRADHEPKDARITLGEWLRYGERRVPELAREVAEHRLRVVTPRGPLRDDEDLPVTRLVQTPSLFDFSKRGSEVVLKER